MSASELHYATTPKRSSSRDINQQNAALLSEVESIEHMISITQQAKVEEIGELSACLQPKGINISAVNKLADSYLQNIPSAPDPLRITIPEDRPQERNRQLRQAIRVAEKRAMLSNEHMDIIISTFKAINIAPESVNFTKASLSNDENNGNATTSTSGVGTPRASRSLNSSSAGEHATEVTNSDSMTTSGHTASSVTAAIKRALMAHDLGGGDGAAADVKRAELVAAVMAEVMPVVDRVESKHRKELEAVRQAQVEAEEALVAVKEEHSKKLEEHATALTMQLLAQKASADEERRGHSVALQAAEEEHALALERQEAEYQAAMEQLGLIQQATKKTRGPTKQTKEETSPTSVSARVGIAAAGGGEGICAHDGRDGQSNNASSPASADEGAEAAAAEEVGAELVEMFTREAGSDSSSSSSSAEGNFRGISGGRVGGGGGDDGGRESAERREKLLLLQRQMQRERQEKLLAMHTAKTQPQSQSAAHALSPEDTRA
jgi:hypothetical protein